MKICLTIEGGPPTSVQLTALTDCRNGQSVAGVTLPASFTAGANDSWTFYFEGTADAYEYEALVTWSDGSTDTYAGTEQGIFGSQEDIESLRAFRAALKALSTNQSYEIEGRKLTRADLPEVRKTITWLENRIAMSDLSEDHTGTNIALVNFEGRFPEFWRRR